MSVCSSVQGKRRLPRWQSLGPFLLSLALIPSQLRKMPEHKPAGGAVGMRPAPSWRTYCTVGGQQACPWAGCPMNGWDGVESCSCLSRCTSSHLSWCPPGPTPGLCSDSSHTLLLSPLETFSGLRITSKDPAHTSQLLLKSLQFLGRNLSLFPSDPHNLSSTPAQSPQHIGSVLACCPLWLSKALGAARGQIPGRTCVSAPEMCPLKCAAGCWLISRYTDTRTPMYHSGRLRNGWVSSRSGGSGG